MKQQSFSDYEYSCRKKKTKREEFLDVMEDIASRIPMTTAMRPEWDRKVLEGLGLLVTVNEQIWNRVWSAEERINFSSTPMFLLCGKKSV